MIACYERTCDHAMDGQRSSASDGDRGGVPSGRRTVGGRRGGPAGRVHRGGHRDDRRRDLRLRRPRGSDGARRRRARGGDGARRRDPGGVQPGTRRRGDAQPADGLRPRGDRRARGSDARGPRPGRPDAPQVRGPRRRRRVDRLHELDGRRVLARGERDRPRGVAGGRRGYTRELRAALGQGAARVERRRGPPVDARSRRRRAAVVLPARPVARPSTSRSASRRPTIASGSSPR